MVRCLFGPYSTVADSQGASAGPSGAATAVTANQTAEKVMTPDVTMKDSGTPDHDKKQTDMGVTHFQCMAARAASCQIEATSISADVTFGKTVKLESEQIGMLNPPGEECVDKTYRGARVKRGGGHGKPVGNDDFGPL